MNSIELKEFRKKFKLTQSSLAKMLGVDIKTIQNWEAGKKIPSTKNEIFRKIEGDLNTATNEAENVNAGSVTQKCTNGDNFNGAGFTVKIDSDYLSLLKKKDEQIAKKDEQIDRLLTLLENQVKKENL